MSDANIAAVLCPTKEDLGKREALVHSASPELPGHSAWRFETKIGKELNSSNNHLIRTNHFAVNPKNIPSTIYKYHVSLYRVGRDGQVDKTDCAGEEDSRVTTSLVLRLKKKYPDWAKVTGFTYDNRSAVFTNAPLPLAARNSKNEPFLEEIVGLPNNEDIESKTRTYRITITLIATILTSALNPEVITALDTSLFSFARWMQVDNVPEWMICGSKIFSKQALNHRLAPAYNATRGFYASLKPCLAGLVLITDMSVNCFLASGQMPDLLYQAGNFRSFNDFLTECKRGSLPGQVVSRLNQAVKNARIRLTHLNHWRKAKSVGPAANHESSSFLYEGKKITVAKYYEIKAKEDPQYGKALHPTGKLKYPELPTINLGSAAKPVLIPPELINVPGGQSRSQVMDGDMTSQMIKLAACRPDERFNYISDGDQEVQGSPSIVAVLRSDPNAVAFGLNNIASKSIASPAIILPQGKLRYGNGIVDPGLSGTWNIDRPQRTFFKPPPQPTKDGYMYGVLVVANRAPGQPGEWERKVDEFIASIEKDSGAAGIRLKKGGPVMTTTDNADKLKESFERMKKGGARIVICILGGDHYGSVKVVSDLMGLSTQCIKWKNVDRPPRGFALNVMLKINIKLGGINHTLISRSTKPPAPGTFQNPPASLSWVFDKPCMLVGIDVSHAEPGSDRQSMAAVVASMDGSNTQYIAHLSAQSARTEMVFALRDAMVSLLNAFKHRNNGKLPEHIVVFRDGVSDGQFREVVSNELPSIKSALELLGNIDRTKVAIVICQKGHHTRFVYEETVGGKTTFINPCPGLVIDATSKEQSIVSGEYNEFYLNSHAAIQGTAKPCKYALIYDEIGFKLSELQLLTYWTTYLYARCNKSVSYATPAYYAHWASKRGKDLFAAGASPQTLIDISEMWSRNDALSTMFFI
jgi:hypothetical protein